MLLPQSHSPTTFFAGCSLEGDEQGDNEERRDHQQFVIVNVGDDLSLLRDHSVERGTSGGGYRVPELRDHRVLKHSVNGRHVLGNVGVIHLRIRDQQAVHHGDADAGADVARQTVETGAFCPLLG